jgi:LysM repeat protein
MTLRAALVTALALALGAPGAQADPRGGARAASDLTCGKKKKPRKKADTPEPVEHRVRPGETLGGIAERYGVTVKEIKRWNRIKGDTIYVDRALTIHSRVPVRAKRELTYTVEKGDTLGSIAERFDMTVRALQQLNRIKDARRLQVGRTLRVIVPGPETTSEAVGRAYEGKLKGGEQLPAGPGYHRKRPAHAWGTNETITQLMRAIATVNRDKSIRRGRKQPIPDLVIGDISRKEGGFLAPHRSHQNGRDVDTGYYHKGEQPTDFVRATKSNLDFELTWAFVDALLDRDAVDYLFIDKKIQEWLYEWALEHKKASKKELDRIFQYPRGGGRSPVIRHEPGHVNHIHIRFRCPSSDSNCS